MSGTDSVAESSPPHEHIGAPPSTVASLFRVHVRDVDGDRKDPDATEHTAPSASTGWNKPASGSHPSMGTRQEEQLHISSLGYSDQANMKHASSWENLPQKLKHDVQDALDCKTMYCDRIFSEEDWSSHVSFRRFLPEPLVLVKMIMMLAFPLCCVFLLSVACGVYQQFVRWPGSPSLNDLNVEFAYSLGGFALSLLLVFKTNTSYARFWEARSAWGNVYTFCRQFIGKAQAYAPDAPLHVRQLLLRWTLALPYLLRSHLMDYKPGSDSLECLLTSDEIEWLRAGHFEVYEHQPMMAVNVLMSALRELGTSDVFRMNMSTHLDGYMTSAAILERIRFTPIPMPYSRHTTRYVTFYVCGLPFALWRHVGWGSLVIAPMITVLLVGIENIGVQIENPIRLLPMAAFCSRIQANVTSIGAPWASSSQKDANAFVKRALVSQPPQWQRNAPDETNSPLMPELSGYVADPDNSPPITYKVGVNNNEDGKSESHQRSRALLAARSQKNRSLEGSQFGLQNGGTSDVDIPVVSRV